MNEHEIKEWIQSNLLTKNEILERYEVKSPSFDNYVTRGKIKPFIKKGPRINLYLKYEVENFLENTSSKQNKKNSIGNIDDSNSDLKIKLSFVDYFLNKTISSHEKNGEIKQWDLDFVLKIFNRNEFVLKVNIFKGKSTINKDRLMLVLLFKDGLHHEIKCSMQEFDMWIDNLTILDINELYELIKLDKDKATLINNTELVSRNKLKLM